jgi:hypothetical protein
MQGKDRFLKVYANLPINLRNEVIVILPNIGPVTWNVAFLEIDGETELGKDIITTLVDLKII